MEQKTQALTTKLTPRQTRRVISDTYNFLGVKRRSKKLRLKVNPKLFDKPYRPLLHCDIPLQIVYGGASSGKSYSVATMIAIWALSGRSIIVGRKVADTIRKSIFIEVEKAIYRQKLQDKFKINKTSMTINSKISKGCIVFIGLDNHEKIKSITPTQADAFDIGVIEEATEITKADYLQFRLRMRGKTQFKKKMILMFNPIYETHWIYKEWFKDRAKKETVRYRSDNLLIMRTTYLDNSYLDSEEIKVLEDLKNTSPYHYLVYALGEFGVLGKRIFTNWETKHFNPEQLHFSVFQGVDFGFSNDPSTWAPFKLDKKNKIIYIYDEIYKKGLHGDTFATEIKEHQTTNNCSRNVVYCDSEDPRMVSELKTNGVIALSAYKAQGTVLKAIDWLQQHKIVVHSKCVNMQDELKIATWKEKNGEPINEPNGIMDHLIAAMRYAFCKEWSHSGKVVGSRSKGLY